MDTWESEIFLAQMQILIENKEKQGKDYEEENYGDTMILKEETEKSIEKHSHN